MSLAVSISSIICMLVGLVCFRQISLTHIRYLILFITVSVLIDNVFLEFIYSDSKTIRVLYCFLHSLEYLICFVIFNQNTEKKSFRYIFLFLAFIFLVFYSIYQISFNLSDKTASTNVFLFDCFFTIFTVLLYFRDIIKSDKIIYLSKEPLFWIATGLLFFMTGNVVSTGFYHQLLKYSKEVAVALYKLNYILNILMNILFSIAFIIATRNNKKLNAD